MKKVLSLVAFFCCVLTLPDAAQASKVECMGTETSFDDGSGVGLKEVTLGHYVGESQNYRFEVMVNAAEHNFFAIIRAKANRLAVAAPVAPLLPLISTKGHFEIAAASVLELDLDGSRSAAVACGERL